MAAAQPGRTEPVVPPVTDDARGIDGLARNAHDAALRGDCASAQLLASRIAKIDPAYHATVIATDATITSCVDVSRSPPRAAATPAGPPQVKEVPTGSPGISGGRLAVEFVLGGVLSIGGGVGGLFLGDAIWGQDDGCDTFCPSNGMVIASVLGLIAGATAGVVLVGSDDDETYSLGMTFGGAAVGGLLGIALVVGNDGGSALPLLAAPTIGAMIGLNMSRSKKARPVPVQTSYPVTQRELVPSPPLLGDRANVISFGTYAF